MSQTGCPLTKKAKQLNSSLSFLGHGVGSHCEIVIACMVKINVHKLKRVTVQSFVLSFFSVHNFGLFGI